MRLLDRAAHYLVVVVWLLVPFHAFLTVWGSTFVGHFLWLRLWDEALLAIVVVLVSMMLWQDRKLWRIMISSRLVQLVAAFLVINVIWGIAAYGMHEVTRTALAYGLIVNLRFLVWFVAIWLVAQRSNWLAGHWKKLVFWPLAVVIVFGLLQFFVWPPDILAHFGYGSNTYVPFITLNQDSSIVRIQSTLRGAYGLGVYLALGITLLCALITFSRRAWRLWLLLAGTGLALVLTFSRSGWIAAVLAIALVLDVRFGRQAQGRIVLLLVGVLLIIGVTGALALRTNSDAQDIVYHVSDHTTATQTSNEQHAGAFSAAVRDIIHEPLGRGPGASGQASWYNTGHPVRNPESLLLQVGEETGWLGLGLFVAILVQLSRELWRRRRNNLALAMFASLIGITLISFVTYSWIDDTLAFIWWGLAAVAITTPPLAKRPTA